MIPFTFINGIEDDMCGSACCEEGCVLCNVERLLRKTSVWSAEIGKGSTVDTFAVLT
jgi:hypothetical protein